MESTILQATSELPGHEQAASFRVGAILATEAIAVCIEPNRPSGVHDAPCAFDRLPVVRLRINILAACEEEFRRQKQKLIRDSRESVSGLDSKERSHGGSKTPVS